METGWCYTAFILDNSTNSASCSKLSQHYYSTPVFGMKGKFDTHSTSWNSPSLLSVSLNKYFLHWHWMLDCRIVQYGWKLIEAKNGLFFSINVCHCYCSTVYAAFTIYNLWPKFKQVWSMPLTGKYKNASFFNFIQTETIILIIN